MNVNNNTKNSIKFLSNEIRTSSVEVNAHKKRCDINNKCTIKLVDSLSLDIKEKIITAARQLKIEEIKNK